MALAASPGFLWVANRGGGTVSRVDVATGQTTTTQVPPGPNSIAIGEGGVWVTSGAAEKLTRLDPSTGARIGRPLTGIGTPRDVAAGEGGVWVLRRDDRLMRVSPGSGSVSRAIPTGPQTTALTTGYGYVWLSHRDGSVTRIDPATLRDAGTAIQVGSDPIAIVATKGFVWTANRGDSTVSRIRPTTSG